jgi:hypothetical protein
MNVLLNFSALIVPQIRRPSDYAKILLKKIDGIRTDYANS